MTDSVFFRSTKSFKKRLLHSSVINVDSTNVFQLLTFCNIEQVGSCIGQCCNTVLYAEPIFVNTIDLNVLGEYRILIVTRARALQCNVASDSLCVLGG